MEFIKQSVMKEIEEVLKDFNPHKDELAVVPPMYEFDSLQQAVVAGINNLLADYFMVQRDIATDELLIHDCPLCSVFGDSDCDGCPNFINGELCSEHSRIIPRHSSQIIVSRDKRAASAKIEKWLEVRDLVLSYSEEEFGSRYQDVYNAEIPRIDNEIADKYEYA